MYAAYENYREYILTDYHSNTYIFAENDESAVRISRDMIRDWSLVSARLYGPQGEVSL